MKVEIIKAGFPRTVEIQEISQCKGWTNYLVDGSTKDARLVAEKLRSRGYTVSYKANARVIGVKGGHLK